MYPRRPPPHAAARMLVLVLAWCLSPRSAPAAETVTFDEAIELSPQAPANRGPQRALAEREAEDAKIGGTAQALTLTVTPGYRMTPEHERGLEGQISLTQSWNLAHLGRARREAAAAERSALSSAARANALATRLEAARRWLDLNALESLDALSSAQLELADQTETFMRRATDAGVRTTVDLAQARVFRSEMARQRLDVHGALYRAALDLSVAMGRKPDPLLRTTGPLPLPGLPDSPDVARFVERAAELPAAAAVRLSSLAARARQAEAAAAMGSILSLGAAVGREPPNAHTVFGVASMAWSPFDRGARSRSLEREQAALLEAEFEQARLGAELELLDAAHELRHARDAVVLMEESWLVAAREAATRVERALEAGEATVYEVLDARRRLVEVEGLLVRARAEQAWAEVRLWLLLAEIEQGTAATR